MSSRQNFITQFFSRIRNKVLTYTQVYNPGLAGKVVQSLTSGSSTKTAVRKKSKSTALAKQEPLPRYAPEGNGRTSGIIAAQAAAAPLPR